MVSRIPEDHIDKMNQDDLIVRYHKALTESENELIFYKNEREKCNDTNRDSIGINVHDVDV